MLRDAAKKVAIPDVFKKIGGRWWLSPATIETAFAKANPSPTTDAMAIKCGGNQLTEVRICFTKELDFRRCLAVNDDTCRNFVRLDPAALTVGIKCPAVGFHDGASGGASSVQDTVTRSN